MRRKYGTHFRLVIQFYDMTRRRRDCLDNAPHASYYEHMTDNDQAAAPMVRAVGLTKAYGDFTAVDGISFDVRQGEIFGFLGPNGAGKTTTINMLIGMAKIGAGSVFYRGEDRTGSIKKAQSLIGVVPDESNLYDELSGYENLCFCGSLYGLRKERREARASELLETFSLAEAAGKRFKAYSKGMKRKLTIAAALMHEPRLLFLDEPTTGIDVASVRQIRGMIKALNEKGMTIFLTTHYIEDAERLCGRVAFINKGKIVKTDSVAKLVEDTQRESILEIAVDPAAAGSELERRIREAFPRSGCSKRGPDSYRITSDERLDIAPMVAFLADRGIPVYEARIVKPSLEDAFVKFAGIDLDALKKEKEKK